MRGPCQKPPVSIGPGLFPRKAAPAPRAAGTASVLRSRGRCRAAVTAEGTRAAGSQPAEPRRPRVLLAPDLGLHAQRWAEELQVYRS